MLLYFLANSQDQFVNCNLNFNGEFSFHYDEKTKSLNIKRNENYLPNYWGEHVQWVTAIAGQNGVGKTTLLERIKWDFLSLWEHECDYIAIYKTDEGLAILYDSLLFEDEASIKINEKMYTIYQRENISISELNIHVRIYPWNLGVDKWNDENGLNLIIQYFREKYLLVYFSVNKNYSEFEEEFNEGFLCNNIEYADLSLIRKIHTAVLEAEYASDFFSKIQEKDMFKLLNYLQDSAHFELVNSVIKIPEEIQVYYDFLSQSDIRIGYHRLSDTNNWINKEGNFKIENSIYNFLWDSKIEISVKEAMYLVFVTQFFKELQLIFKENTNLSFKESDTSRKIEKFEDITIFVEEFVSQNISVTLLSENSKKKFSDYKIEKLEIIKKILNSYKINDFEYFLDIERIERLSKKFEKVKELLNSNEDIKIIKDIRSLFNIFEDIENLLNGSEYKDIETLSKSFEYKDIGTLLKNFEDIKNIKDIENLLSSYTEIWRYFNDDFFEKIESNTIDLDDSSNFNNHIKLAMPIIKISKENSEVAYTFFEKYKQLKGRKKPLFFKWNNLSAGEAQLLNLFTGLGTAIKKKYRNNDKKKYQNKEKILILLDEVEISLHPMLQKQFMRMLMEILNKTAEKYGQKIQVILTTHSPFVLSELPLHSLILLEKDHEQKVQVKNELENLTTTLGANIHELFSHSFFLTGGLIGEYAKERINEVANNLLGIESNLNKEDIRKFINQVGEPIIKSRLVELFEQKYALTKGEEMEKLQKQMAELQERMKRLEDGDGK